MKSKLRSAVWAIIAVLSLPTCFTLYARLPAQSTKDELTRLAKEATGIRIVTSAFTADHKYEKVVLADISNRVDVANFFETLRVEPSIGQAFGLQCGCSGDFTVMVSGSGETLSEISLHHGLRVRVPNTTMGDARLEPDAAYELGIWLTEHEIIKKKNELLIQPAT